MSVLCLHCHAPTDCLTLPPHSDQLPGGLQHRHFDLASRKLKPANAGAREVASCIATACACAPTYDLCLLGWPILSDETFLVVLAGRADPGPVSRDGASQMQMSRVIDALNLAEIELAAHHRESMAPEDPDPVEPVLHPSASQQASQINQ